MAYGYNKTSWIDRIVQFPRRFTKSGETSSQVTLVADPGTVTQPGTPVNASTMNNIESGIEKAHKKATGAVLYKYKNLGGF